MAVWRASLTIRDEQGKARVMSLHLNAPDVINDPRDDPFEYIADYAVLVNEVITGAIVDISLSRSVDVSALDIRRVPLASSDVEEGALFVWQAGNEPVQQRIPTFAEAFILPGTDQVDQADVDVSALIEMSTNPEDLPADWTVGPSDSRGVSIRDVRSAKESFKAK